MVDVKDFYFFASTLQKVSCFRNCGSVQFFLGNCVVLSRSNERHVLTLSQSSIAIYFHKLYDKHIGQFTVHFAGTADATVSMPISVDITLVGQTLPAVLRTPSGTAGSLTAIVVAASVAENHEQ